MGHRGAAGLEPENTFRGFQRALELGVHRIEVDVRLTSDGHPILMHDETVDRTTDGAGRVEALSLAEIRRLDAGMGERVPALADFLEWGTGRVIMHLELKATGTSGPVVRLVRTLRAAALVRLISFDPGRLAEVRQLDPHLELAQLWESPPGDAVESALRLDVREISVHFRHFTPRLAEEAHARGLDVSVWTPNEEDELRTVIAGGADIVCTDRPDRALAALGCSEQ